MHSRDQGHKDEVSCQIILTHYDSDSRSIASTGLNFCMLVSAYKLVVNLEYLHLLLFLLHKYDGNS